MEQNMTEENQNTDLLAFFKALADANRLRIIGVLANESSSVEKLAEQLGLSEATVSHHLSRLAEIGLVSAKSESYYSIYSLQNETLEKMAKKILARENLPLLAKDVDLDAYDRKVLKEFTFSNGSIKTFPAQRKKLDVVVSYVAKAFELEKKYTEKEVNELLKAFNEDFATLRRELIDMKFMARQNGEYWLTELGYNSSRSYR
jgi:predicted transcriptional regulator